MRYSIGQLMIANGKIALALCVCATVSLSTTSAHSAEQARIQFHSDDSITHRDILETLLAWVRDVENTDPSIVSVVTITDYFGVDRPASASATSEAPAAQIPNRIASEWETRWMKHSHMWLGFWKDITDPSQAPPDIVEAWTGDAWIRRTARGSQPVWDIHLQPVSMTERECLLAFIGIIPRSPAITKDDLSSIIHGSELIEFIENGDEQSFRLRMNQHNHLVLRVQHIEGQRRIDLVRREAFSGDEETQDRQLGAVWEYRIEQWERYDGVLLPKLAYRDAWLFQHDKHGSPISSMGRIKFERRTADRIDAVDLAQRINVKSLIPGASTIVDHRIQGIYEMGGTTVRIDGNELELGGPVSPDNVLEMLAAVVTQPSDSNGGSGTPDEDDEVDETQ